ncbi:hypothetical protein DPSP01_004856 [Paraphaeosphaeria sporulosa]
MRLIDVRDGSFKEFIGSQIPEYAILSHTWEDEEVSYKDVIDNVHKRKKSFAKIEATCAIAASQGIGWAWVDTCCIDKSSSAELTEAINSMYRWYQRSKICYAYLADLPRSEPLEEALPKCRWFTRGWTLQELIAPDSVIFYDEEWNIRGNKHTLMDQLSAITGIGGRILGNTMPLSAVAVAERMSWAARRRTTRIEDTAYCLLGIFDVNMPLLYGEEEKAFGRLQEEIIKTRADRSIFAWSLPQEEEASADGANTRTLCGVFAASPAMFENGGTYSWEPGSWPMDVAVTNKGVKIRVNVVTVLYTSNVRYVLFTDCRHWEHLELPWPYFSERLVPASSCEKIPGGCAYCTTSKMQCPGFVTMILMFRQISEIWLPWAAKQRTFSERIKSQRSICWT